MNDEASFGGSWLFAFLIIALIFNGGFGGIGGGNSNVAAYATMADVNNAINNQSQMQALNNLATAQENSNYQTAQLITNQTENLMSQNNTNLINAIQGFNNIGQQIMNQTNVLGSKLDNMSYQIDKCCCSIKTQMLQDRLADAQAIIVSQNAKISNNEQSQYLLGQMGRWSPYPPVAGAATQNG